MPLWLTRTQDVAVAGLGLRHSFQRHIVGRSQDHGFHKKSLNQILKTRKASSMLELAKTRKSWQNVQGFPRRGDADEEWSSPPRSGTQRPLKAAFPHDALSPPSLLAMASFLIEVDGRFRSGPHDPMSDAACPLSRMTRSGRRLAETTIRR